MTMGVEPVKIEIGEISDLEKKIIRQVEYYFGDYNLSNDKFLKEQMKDDGWVSMEIMMKFKRLQQLSDDTSIITEALKKSPTKLMEVNEDNTKIRRSPEKPLPENPEDLRKELDLRTLYVKGFGPQATLDELLEFFRLNGNPENIYMRRTKERKFKGSVYVTFATKEGSEAFLTAKDTKYKGTELIKERKNEYLERKNQWYDNLRKEKEEKKIKREEKAKEDKEAEPGFVKGCILKLSGLKEDIMWEDIKEVLSPHGAIAYVDYSKGRPIAFVRFDSAVANDVLVAAANEDKIIKVKDSEANAFVLEDEEEVQYWQTVSQSKKDRNQKKFHRGGGRRGGRGGGGGRFFQRNKRKHEDGQGGPPRKSAKAVKD